MSVFTDPHFDSHEQVVFAQDAASGLRAIIAIHDTALGPAVGGCRMWPYASDEEALADVLRLSRGMSYKNALADLPLGGGKSVIIGDSRTDKTEALLRAFGRVVESLGGRYRTAEDVGTSVADMDIIGQETRHALGRSQGRAAIGDPSPYTARGGLAAIKAAVRHKLGRTTLVGLRIAIQGVGHVGAHLARLLTAEGAELVIADVNTDQVRAVAEETGATPVEVERILSLAADVVVPCAMGAVLDDQSIATLNTPIVAGLANNQLAEARHGPLLHSRGILYAPDYVANAGGIIAVAAENAGMTDLEQVTAKVDAIERTLTTLFERADSEGRPTADVADSMARDRLARAHGTLRQGTGEQHPPRRLAG
ncbi:Glu/Leu/Phe/Val dehydrogenase dimerization domain-containing protein [Rhodospirillum sp. A1_3_36]|uniref:Glu/Leu/Phe/Val dehydrogenase dimerization domain-containing protein n=1 Tax=Rhodospirillum sp. A1_3_36 TaxID=3391666 RepID=UPI0039A556A5